MQIVHLLRFLDLLPRFDDALDWQLDDPLLADPLPSDTMEHPWSPNAIPAA